MSAAAKAKLATRTATAAKTLLLAAEALEPKRNRDGTTTLTCPTESVDELRACIRAADALDDALEADS